MANRGRQDSASGLHQTAGVSPERVACVRDDIAESLDLRYRNFTDDMHLTFIARHKTNPDCYMIVTDDDIKALVSLLASERAKR